MRSFFLAVILMIGVVFVFWRISEVEAIVDTLQNGDWRFLFLGVIVVFIWLFTAGGLIYAVYRALGLDEKIGHLFFVAGAANFMNITMPAAGMSGMAVFLSEAKRKNLPRGRVTVASALSVLFEYTGFICILAVGIIVLFRRNSLNIAQIIATAVLLAIVAAFVALVILAMKSGEKLGRRLVRISKRINRILQPIVRWEYLSEERAYDFAIEISSGLRELSTTPAKLIIPAFLGLLKQSWLIVVLYLTFCAFAVPVSIGTLIAGFSIGYLFVIVSPTPAGLGVVEGALTLALSSMYIPLGTATVITLAYRGLTFWIPFFFGMYAFRHLGGAPQVESTA